jgi:hypothetical protein
MRACALALVALGILGCLAAPAAADVRADIAAKARAAMASYDAMDYEVARKQLYQALAIAKKARLDKDPIVARVYVDLAITQLAGSDQDAAKLSLLSAAQIDPKIAIDAAYKSPELVRLLDEARAVAAGFDSSAEAATRGDSDGVDCKAIRGVQHTVVEVGKRGVPEAIEAWIGGDVVPARVAVMYRAEGAVDFTEAKAARQGSCKYTATIPASATQGGLVHYYIAAYDQAGKVLAAKGSSGAPNVIAIGQPHRTTGPDVASAGPGDSENPLGAAPPDARPAADLSDSAVPADKPHKIRLAVSAGSGIGYVTGTTEGGNRVQSCCIGTSLLVITPELGYYVTPRLTLGLAGRIGFPIGANTQGHSTVAPAGFLRVRYALSASGTGLGAMAEIGGGILRNTLKLDDTSAAPGMETDVVAQGPLLLGAGIGYSQRLGNMVAVFVDLEAIAGLAVVGKVGTAVHLNSGISTDMKLGLAVGF